MIGALYLKLMDDRMEKTGLFYVRFMDDWIVLSPNRWKLKKAVQIVNQTLNELKVEKHPDKTFIGRIAKGFDFLGYSFEPKGLSITPKTLANFLDRIAQLYEQGATVKRIGKYVRNWLRWVRAGVEITFRRHRSSPQFVNACALASLCGALLLTRDLVFSPLY